ncbi:MAG: dTMP kinase [Actinomycetota bacterium]|nr:dTMP kinase [Actinomycetota bacterium]
MKDKQKGWFITFEGLDGSGKSTQINMAEKYLQSRGFEVVSTFEPGGTPMGDRVGEILLDKDNDGMCAKTEVCLFLASRAQLVSQVIKPALSEKKIVLCDRFFDSSVAYQGFARGLGADEILELSLWATGGLVPDLTFLLTVDMSHSEARKKERGLGQDRLESQKDDFKAAGIRRLSGDGGPV